MKEIRSKHITDEAFLRVFSRTIMELPEPRENTRRYNINHHEITNRDIVVFSLFYKLKVVVSNFVLKFIARKVLTRTSFRLYSPYVAMVGTGVWDAFVFYKSIRYSHYKIMVRYTIDQLLIYKRELMLQDENIKAILSRYYYYSEYNNNLDYFLGTLQKQKPFAFSKEEYLDENVFKKCTQKLLVLLFCFKVEIHSKREKDIIKKIGNAEEFKRLRRALKEGNIEYIREYVCNINET